MPTNGIPSIPCNHNIEDIRAEVINLYQYENKTLEEIRTQFASRGVTASLPQWKSQLKIWGIGKYNREADVSFAIRKADDRKQNLGKETVFSIRGQKVSKEHIERYRQRRKKPLPDTTPGMRTPDVIKYHTPPGSPRDFATAVVSLETEPILGSVIVCRNPEFIPYAELSPGSQRHLLADTASFDEITPDIGAIGISGHGQSYPYKLPDAVLCKPLTSPAELLNIETGLAGVRELYRNSIIFGELEEYGALLQPLESITMKFFQCSLSISQNLLQGAVYLVRTHWTQAIGCLPAIMESRSPLYLCAIAQALQKFLQRGQNQAARSYLFSIWNTLARLLPAEHPTLRVIKALYQSGNDVLLLAETCLLLRSEYLAKSLTEGHSQWLSIMTARTSFLKGRHDWYGCLRSLESILGPLILRYGYHNVRYTYHQLSCVTVHTELGNYERASQILDEVSHIMNESPETGRRACGWMSATRGELRRRTCQPGAIEDLQRALVCYQSMLGTDSDRAGEAARHLKVALEGNDPFVVSF